MSSSQMMKAAVLHGARELRMESVPVPVPLSHEVLVQILSNGLCGSDIHFFQYGKLGPFVVDRPYIPGHEAVGRVVVANSVGTLRSVGDLVVIEPGIPCGKCEACRSGRYNLCPNVVFLSAPPINGTFSEFVAIDASMTHLLPAGLNQEAGALAEPLSVGMQACKRADLHPGSTVCIIGSGPIGLITMKVARAFGAARVIMLDVLPSRLDSACALGADLGLDSTTPDVVDSILSYTDGRGVDVVFDTSGSSKGAASAPYYAKRGGVVVLVGWPETAVFPFPMEMVIEKELDVRGVNRYCNTFPAVLSLLASGSLSLDGIVSHRFAFDNVIDAFQFAVEHKNEVRKIVIS